MLGTFTCCRLAVSHPHSYKFKAGQTKIVELVMVRSSRPEVFCKKGVRKNFTIFTGKQLCQSLFFNKLEGLRQAIIGVTFFNLVIHGYRHVTCSGILKVALNVKYSRTCI